MLLLLAGLVGFVARFEPLAFQRGDQLLQDRYMAALTAWEPSRPTYLLSLEEPAGGSFDAATVLPEVLGRLRGARAVVLPPGDELMLDASGDRKIAEAVRGAGNVVSGITLGGGLGAGGWLRFAAVAGVDALEPDADGLYRSFAPFVRVEGKMVPSLALAAYLHVTRDVPRVRENFSSSRVLVLGEHRLPLDSRGRLPVAFSRENPRRLSYASLNKEELLSGDALRQAIVVVELPSEQRRLLPVPVSAVDSTASAGKFWAWSIGTLFVPALPQKAAWMWPAALAWAAMLFTVVLVWWMPLRAMWAAMLGVLVLVGGCTAMVFSTTLVWLSPLVPALGVLAAGSLAVGLRWARYRRETALGVLAGDVVRGFLEGRPANDATFEECLRALWSDLERLTGVRILDVALPQKLLEDEALDGGVVLARSDFLYLVRNDVDVPRYRLYARQGILAAGDEHRFVALGWDRPMAPEILRSLALLISVSSWFHAGTRASEQRLRQFKRTLAGVLNDSSRTAPAPLVHVALALARELRWQDSLMDDLRTVAAVRESLALRGAEEGVGEASEAPATEGEGRSAIGFLKSEENPLEEVLEVARIIVREMGRTFRSPSDLRERVLEDFRRRRGSEISSALLRAVEALNYEALLRFRGPRVAPER